MKILLIYLIIVNIIALIVTVYDKCAAQKHRRRVSERALFFISFIGGAPVMYLTMLVISHKTRKKRFMIGVPMIIIIEFAVAFVVLRYVFKAI